MTRPYSININTPLGQEIEDEEDKPKISLTPTPQQEKDTREEEFKARNQEQPNFLLSEADEQAVVDNVVKQRELPEARSAGDVKAARLYLNQGVPRADIEAGLVSSGWTPEQAPLVVDRAMRDDSKATLDDTTSRAEERRASIQTLQDQEAELIALLKEDPNNKEQRVALRKIQKDKQDAIRGNYESFGEVTAALTALNGHLEPGSPEAQEQIQHQIDNVLAPMGIESRIGTSGKLEYKDTKYGNWVVGDPGFLTEMWARRNEITTDIIGATVGGNIGYGAGLALTRSPTVATFTGAIGAGIGAGIASIGGEWLDDDRTREDFFIQVDDMIRYREGAAADTALVNGAWAAGGEVVGVYAAGAIASKNMNWRKLAGVFLDMDASTYSRRVGELGYQGPEGMARLGKEADEWYAATSPNSFGNKPNINFIDRIALADGRVIKYSDLADDKQLRQMAYLMDATPSGNKMINQVLQEVENKGRLTKVNANAIKRRSDIKTQIQSKILTPKGTDDVITKHRIQTSVNLAEAKQFFSINPNKTAITKGLNTKESGEKVVNNLHKVQQATRTNNSPIANEALELANRYEKIKANPDGAAEYYEDLLKFRDTARGRVDDLAPVEAAIASVRSNLSKTKSGKLFLDAADIRAEALDMAGSRGAVNLLKGDGLVRVEDLASPGYKAAVTKAYNGSPADKANAISGEAKLLMSVFETTAEDSGAQIIKKIQDIKFSTPEIESFRKGVMVYGRIFGNDAVRASNISLSGQSNMQAFLSKSMIGSLLVKLNSIRVKAIARALPNTQAGKDKRTADLVAGIAENHTNIENLDKLAKLY